MLLPMSMARSIYRILPDFGAMVSTQLYVKPTKWDNEVFEIMNFSLSEMLFICRVDQPMTRGQANKMSEDIDRKKTDRKGFTI